MSKLPRIALAIFVSSLTAFASPSVEGIHNFYQVDSHVYRGGQPTATGFRYLASIGVKTVIDLRGWDERAAAERQLVTSLGMTYVSVPMGGLTPPTTAQITRILMLLENSNSGGVFVHCRRGADRTGAVIGAYRVDHYQWDNARALKEAMHCGMAFFQVPRQNFIRDFHPLTVRQTVPVSAPAPGSSLSPAAALVPQP